MKNLTLLLVLSITCFFFSSTTFAQTTKNASYSTFKTWSQTEPDMQSTSAVAAIKTKLRDNDPYLWAEPVKVVTINGRGYILDGHHRVKAATDIQWSGKIPYWDIPVSDISEHSFFSNADEVVDAAENY